MKLTKFEHACFVVENEGQSLVVDPGVFTTDFTIPNNVVAVVITHEHPDHFDKARLQTVVDANPATTIIAHASITAQLDGFRTMSVVPNEGVKIGSFELEFFGGEHAAIFKDMQPLANLGVLINETLYYPGDSFTVPDRPVAVLALPVSAPWMKISEAMDFLDAVKPQKLVFPTHDAILSDVGKSLPDRMLVPIVEKTGAVYKRLSDPIDI